MTVTIEDREAYVAACFDNQEQRFKPVVREDDYRLTALLNRLPSVRGKRILDLGCGKGRFAKRLSDLGAEVYGIDISKSMISSASGVIRVQASARLLPFRPATFDAVIAVEVFEHLLDVPEALCEIRRVLRPSGALLVIDKNIGSINPVRLGVPNLVLKWLDEIRGRWMYPFCGPVRERWFWPHALRREVAGCFENAEVEFLLRREESELWVFRHFPSIRLMTLWSATAPKEVAT